MNEKIDQGEMPFNDEVDFDKLCQSEAHYAVSLNPSYFTRLSEQAIKISTPIDADFRFYYDMQGLRTIEGSISCGVTLMCERCNRPFDTRIEASFKSTCDEKKAISLRLVDKLDLVPLNEHGMFELKDYLEDCLLLEIPIAPVHDDTSVCGLGDEYVHVYGSIPQEECANPFIALKALKGKIKS